MNQPWLRMGMKVRIFKGEEAIDWAVIRKAYCNGNALEVQLLELFPEQTLTFLRVPSEEGDRWKPDDQESATAIAPYSQEHAPGYTIKQL